MAKRNRTKNHKKNRRSTRRVAKRGGGWGYNASSTAGIIPGTVSNLVAWTGIGDCRAQKPDYEIPYSDYTKYSGLPGLSIPAQFQKGGKSRKNRKQRKSRKQKGGRYGFAPDMIPGVTPNGAAWWAGTYAPVQRIPCEAAATTHNPLNPLPTTPITVPYPPQVDTTSRIETQLAAQKGGAALAPATYGVGNVDSMYYYGPTAGYDNVPSTWKDSVGAPVQLQIPFAARAYNPACMTTEHPPALTGALYVAKGGGLGDAASGLVNTTIGAMTGTVGTSANLAANAGRVMLGTTQGVIGSAGNLGSTLTTAPTQAVGAAFGGLANAATGTVTGMTGAATDAARGFYDVAKGTGSGFAAAGRALVGGGAGAATAGVVNTTVGALTGAVGTSADLATGAAKAMAGTAQQVVGTAGQVGSTITTAPAQAVGTAFSGLANAASGAVTGTTGAVADAGKGYLDVLTKAGTGFANAGRALVGGRRRNNNVSVSAYVGNNTSRNGLPMPPANALPGNMKKNNKSILNTANNVAQGAANTITGTANTIAEGVGNVVGNLFGSAPAANAAMLGGKRKKNRKNRKTRRANRR